MYVDIYKKINLDILKKMYGNGMEEKYVTKPKKN